MGKASRSKREKRTPPPPPPEPQNDRSQYIGGSDISALLGVAPRSWARSTPYALWMDKVHPKERDAKQEEQMRKVLLRGKRLEPVVLDMLRDEYPGIRVERVNRRHRRIDHSFIQCEVDFEFFHDAATDAALGLPPNTYLNGEIKTVHPFMADEWGEPGTDQIPVHYAAQVMYGLMVTGRAACLVVALFGADELRTYVVRRNDELCVQLRDIAKDFWNNFVMTKEPPPVMSEQDLKEKFGDDGGGIKFADDALMTRVQALRTAKAQMKDLSRQIETIELGVKMEMGDNAILMHLGEVLATWKTVTTERIDQTALKASHPILAKEFTKESKSRVFRLKEESK